MFSKAEFVRFLKEALAKDEKKDDQKELQAELIRLLKNLGCVNLLYPHAKAIHSFIKEIKSQLTPIFETFNVRYLEKKAEPGAKEAGPEEANREESALVSVHNYDHSRSFFRNLAEMIRTLKHAQKHEQLKQEQNRRKSQMDVTETQLKLKYIEVIFSVPGENLRPAHAFKLKEPVEQHYQPHLQTASSTVFKILSKPDLEENE